MDDAETIQKDWTEKGVYDTLDRLYREIWVYGEKTLYDPVSEYAIPDAISQKMQFTGYIPRKKPDEKAIQQIRKEQGIKNDEKLVVVTTGGGGDGYPVLDTYLKMLENGSRPISHKSVLVTGPFMPGQQRKEIFDRAKKLGVRAYRFYRWMVKIIAAADVVVGMGGYNTVCEILTQCTPSIIIPRENPRREQLIRAEVLNSKKLLSYIPLQSLTPDLLRAEIRDVLNNPEPYKKAIADFRLTGFDVMHQRLQSFR